MFFCEGRMVRMGNYILLNTLDKLGQDLRIFVKGYLFTSMCRLTVLNSSSSLASIRDIYRIFLKLKNSGKKYLIKSLHTFPIRTIDGCLIFTLFEFGFGKKHNEINFGIYDQSALN